ncbi:DinB family protein [Nesterenkonia sp. HG001]|uniref:DinB family protein n=1 Tax=Nesterenkonia sp. HG001 TaxID=2983207 RepID=UPI002AC4D41E|nr:DinB family protein [Nesterenkonia sp. HG001]MDZ5077516.1 DinB family protein [Nesterenkonia sp. HG001]
MSDDDAESEMLLRYLQGLREALLWKLDGVPEHDVRRPLTATGTNLLGLVKHVASMEMGYFTAPLGRPSPVPMPWLEAGAALNADLYATEEESSEWVRDFYRTSWRTTDDAVAELGLGAPAQVPWWGKNGRTTLGRLVVHLIAETARHAGHADILREQLDGAVGMQDGNDNMPPAGDAEWQDHVVELQRIADEFL